MIGVFDSGLGGLTVQRALAQRFPEIAFLYLADHRNAPYGNRPSGEVVELTRSGVEQLFERGCNLVLLGCNTATAVAARSLQQVWLPNSRWRGTHNVLGIVAPTVEAATQTPWGIATPQYPQKYNSDVIAVFGTTRTIESGVYREEIRKRCPKVTVIEQVCPHLAGAIEAKASTAELDHLVASGVNAMLSQTDGVPPHRAILGCTHFPLVADLFASHLPPFTRLLSQPEIVADSFEFYLVRRPQWAASRSIDETPLRLLTTGDCVAINDVARVFWNDAPPFHHLSSLCTSS